MKLTLCAISTRRELIRCYKHKTLSKIVPHNEKKYRKLKLTEFCLQTQIFEFFKVN